MSDQQFYAFMVWHRGLAIPRARNLNDPTVQRGKELFYKMGCTSCHRPKWETGDDNYWLPQMMVDKNYTKLPRYAHQTIYPYSDYVQHKLYMKNDVHGSWCRTIPLWGRGLELLNTGAEDRLHDCRARNEKEAILGMGIFIGAIWANVSWGNYWTWDPKETWALITLLIYAIPLHTQSLPALQRPRTYHLMMVLSFLTIIMTYFGVNYFLSGMHSYA